jgi:NTP pyrophosphatase (non-canonical NTP hydrolase)
MNNETYLQESARSVSPIFNTDKEEKYGLLLKETLQNAINVGVDIDTLKRKIFYGKAIPENVKIPAATKYYYDVNSCTTEALFTDGKLSGNYSADFVHGVFGVVGETGELIQALTQSVHEKTPVDRVNVIEECGDLLWYIALILRSQGSTFDEAMDKNIAKLRKRFPGQFTSEHALNRDLEAERKILAGGTND